MAKEDLHGLTGVLQTIFLQVGPKECPDTVTKRRVYRVGGTGAKILNTSLSLLLHYREALS